METEFAWEMPGLQVTDHGTSDKPMGAELVATIARQVGTELAGRVRVVQLQLIVDNGLSHGSTAFSLPETDPLPHVSRQVLTESGGSA
ncbi:hypothetical protein AMK10_14285 [Streptomyces sp. CB02058]|nr:hypothetical protein AMK10_14285 [Streptomyces sp. CB02058]